MLKTKIPDASVKTVCGNKKKMLKSITQFVYVVILWFTESQSYRMGRVGRADAGQVRFVRYGPNLYTVN